MVKAEWEAVGLGDSGSDWTKKADYSGDVRVRCVPRGRDGPPERRHVELDALERGHLVRIPFHGVLLVWLDTHVRDFHFCGMSVVC